MTPVDHALVLRRRGLSVIPVPRPRPGIPAGRPGDGKVPAIAWKAYQERLPSEAEIRAWWRKDPDANIAVVTGAVSGIVVVDADTADSLRWVTRHLSYTPWQVQTARGFHLYYRYPTSRVGNRARVETRDGWLAIDVRGDGGFVIAAGSSHASGRQYLEAGDWNEPRERVPVFWPGWLERPERRARSVYSQSWRPKGDLVERGRRYLAAIPRPEIGHGSDAATLYAACRLVRGFGIGEADATALLWEWAGGRPGWTYEWVRQKVQHAIKYGSEPIGALR